MNLKSRLASRSTCTVKFITDVQCIFSDEVSPTHIDALTIMTAATKDELWRAVYDKAVATASTTKFKPVINVITPADELTTIRL